MSSRYTNVSLEAVAAYWDRRPCNIRHSPRPVGSRAYFDEVEARKYFVEPHILRFADFPAWNGKRVLEIGCGIGTDTIHFARCGATVTAVDLSAQSLAIARQRADVFGLAQQIRFLQANAEELSYALPPEPYDLVYSFGVLHHTPRPEKALAELGKYLHAQSVLKVMLYHRYAWKVFWLLLTAGKGQFWKLAEVVARHSEAQTGCPVTYTYSRRAARRLLEQHGLHITDMWVDHIFPYRIEDYKAYRYVKEWYWRCLPQKAFRWLERHLGWHLCITARPRGSAMIRQARRLGGSWPNAASPTTFPAQPAPRPAGRSARGTDCS